MGSPISRLPFPLLFGLRSHFGSRYRVLSVLTVLAVATSVALASALEMASHSVEAELEATATALAGAAQLEISGGDAGVSEELLSIAAHAPGVRNAAPLIEARFRLRSGPLTGTAIHVLGVDLLDDSSVRSYRFGGPVEERDALGFLAGGNSITITRSLATQLQAVLGDTLSVEQDGKPVDLTVGAILQAGGVSEAFGGRVAIMDVYVLQTLLGRHGFLDRIDIVVDPEAAPDEVREQLEAQLHGKALVRRAAARDAWVDGMVAAIRVLVWALLGVGVVVAVLLSYSTISLSVDRRIRDFALLRSCGLESRKVRRLIQVDALLIGALATLVGLGAGSALARAFVSVLSGVSVYLQGVETRTLTMSPWTIAVATCVGLGVALLGSIEPSLRASAAAPLDVLRSRPSGQRPFWLRTSVALAVLIALWSCLSFIAVPLPALVRIPSIFILGLAIIAIAALGGFRGLVIGLRPYIEGTVSSVGRLAGASLLARPFHTALTVATTAGVIAGVTVVLIIVTSLSATLDEWTADQYPDGVFITAGTPLGGRNAENITPQVREIIRSTPGVRAVFDHYTTGILYQGEEVLLAGGSMDAMARHGRLPALDVDPRDLAEAIAEGAAAISDQFAKRFGVLPGDRITLATPQGSREFEVAGVMRDYAGPAGSINIDMAVFDSLWPRAGSTNMVVWIDGSPEPTLGEISRRVGNQQDLFFVFGDELARYASRVIGQFTGLADVIVYLTASLGGIAVMNLLLSAVLERRRELALLRSTGATNRQLMALVVIDSLILSTTSTVAGVTLGLACAYPMVVDVMRSEFSWWIEFSFSAVDLAKLAIGVVLAALVASAYPALQARESPGHEALAPE